MRSSLAKWSASQLHNTHTVTLSPFFCEFEVVFPSSHFLVVSSLLGKLASGPKDNGTAAVAWSDPGTGEACAMSWRSLIR